MLGPLKNWIVSLILSFFVAGCAGQEERPATYQSAGTEQKYIDWTNQQLEMKVASLKRQLSKSNDNGNESMGAALFSKMAEDDKQKELEGIESELMHRDPSGNLLEQSSKM